MRITPALSSKDPGMDWHGGTLNNADAVFSETDTETKQNNPSGCLSELTKYQKG